MTKRTDTPKPIDPSLLPVLSLPIGEALQALRDTHALTSEDYAALIGPDMLTAVRTYGDLLAALRSGDLASVPGVDTERLKQVLGVEGGG